MRMPGIPAPASCRLMRKIGFAELQGGRALEKALEQGSMAQPEAVSAASDDGKILFFKFGKGRGFGRRPL